MEFNLNKTLEILERTPAVLNTMLSGISNEWTSQNEGGATWSPFEVMGHLLFGEKYHFGQRIEIILTGKNDGKFLPFDQSTQFEESKGRTIQNLLDEYAACRKKNVELIRSSNLSEDDLNKTGIHARFGPVTLKVLLGSWAVHDLNHIAQINRVMAKQYKTEVGPWSELKILNI